MSMLFSILYHNAFWKILFNLSFAFTVTLQSPSNPSNILPSLINTTNSSIPLAIGDIQWQCEEFWPTPSPGIARSCVDALHRMNFVPGSATQQFIWGPRHIGRRYDVYLPQRVYSSDGKCYIEVKVEAEHPWDSTARASQAQVKKAVEVLMMICLVKSPPEGGRAWNFNADGNIEVSVRVPQVPIEPPDTLCYGAMPSFVEPSCRDILNGLPGEPFNIFRIGPSSDPSATIHTPFNIMSQDRRCALTISTTGPTDLITWNGVWEVGSELKDICARQGKRGRVINLGYDTHIVIQLTSPRADVSSS